MSGTVAISDLSQLYCPVCERSYAEGRECSVDGTRLVKLVAVVDPQIGRELDGRFTIIEKLGQGGMGAVYRARQHSVDREVAIKVIHPNLLSDVAIIKRFLREARLASRLNHPNAVGVLDFGQTEDGMFYLVMELLSGKTLADVFEADGVFEPRRLIRIGIQICDALEAANALSIVHRDLKPDNIIVLDTARDFVKVLDFGLAKSLERDAAEEVSISGILQGTPSYIAPERACGDPGDPRSDLYSLGCMLFQLGSGTLPYAAPGMDALLLQHVSAPVPVMTGVPAELAHVVGRMLAKQPAQRYQSAAETRFALEAVLEMLRPVSNPPFAFEPSSPEIAVACPPVAEADRQPIARADTMLASQPVAVPATPTRRARRPLIAALAFAIAVVVAMIAHRAADQAPALTEVESASPPPVVAAPVEIAPTAVVGDRRSSSRTAPVVDKAAAARSTRPRGPAAVTIRLPF